MANPAGALLARGPMAQDKYTQLFNLLFRWPPIAGTPAYVFGHLSTHDDSRWRISVPSICAQTGLGTTSVNNALKVLEKHHLLIRERERRSDGTLGQQVYFFTDLALQIREMGIEDEEVIGQRVRDEFEAWKNSRSEPTCEKPSEGDRTTENLSTSEPVLDGTSSGSSSFGSAPPHKKNKNKKTNGEEHQTGTAPPADDVPPPPPEEEQPACLPEDQPQEDEYGTGRRLLREASVTWPKPLGGHAVEKFAPLVTDLAAEHGDARTLNRLVQLGTEGDPRNPAGQLYKALEDVAASRDARRDAPQDQQQPEEFIDDVRRFRDEHGDVELYRLSKTRVLVVRDREEKRLLSGMGIIQNVKIRSVRAVA